MTDLIAVHISRENNLHLQSLAKKNKCTVDDLINEAVCEYYADEIRQADTPQTKGLKTGVMDLGNLKAKDLKDGISLDFDTDCGWK